MYKVIGFEFFSGKDGRQWANLFVGYVDQNVKGLKCEKIFTSRSLIPNGLEVGCDINISIGLDKRIISITIDK